MENQKFITRLFVMLILASCASSQERVALNSGDRLPASEVAVDRAVAADTKKNKADSGKKKAAMRVLFQYLNYVYQGATLNESGLKLLETFELSPSNEERAGDASLVLSHYRIGEPKVAEPNLVVPVQFYYLGHIEQSRGFLPMAEADREKEVEFKLKLADGTWFIESPYMIDPVMNREFALRFLRDHKFSTTGL